MVAPSRLSPVHNDRDKVQNALAGKSFWRAFRRTFQERAFRRGTKAVASIENTSSPRALVPVLRACRMPHSGRFSEVRSDSTSLAKRMVSPANTGLIQPSSRKPGDGPPIRRGFPGLTLAVGDQELHADRTDMPARRGKAAEQRFPACLLIEMEGLRIEL